MQNAFKKYLNLLLGVWNKTFLLTTRWRSESYLEVPTLDPAKNFIFKPNSDTNG